VVQHYKANNYQENFHNSGACNNTPKQLRAGFTIGNSSSIPPFPCSDGTNNNPGKHKRADYNCNGADHIRLRHLISLVFDKAHPAFDFRLCVAGRIKTRLAFRYGSLAAQTPAKRAVRNARESDNFPL
jgi:hypothetical protein